MNLDIYIGNNSTDPAITVCPKWDPTKSVPTYFNGYDPIGGSFNNIATLSNVSTIKHEDYRTYSAISQIKLGGSYYGLVSNVCTYTNDPNSLSFSLDLYRNAVSLGFPSSTLISHNEHFDPFIAWPLAAYIDDIWTNWDQCNITNNGSSILNAWDLPNGLDLSTLTAGYPGYNPSSKTLTWDNHYPISSPTNNYQNKIVIKGRIIIPAGYTLKITNGQRVEFEDERYACLSSGIDVLESTVTGTNGGRLIVENNSILDGISSLGNGSRPSSGTAIGGMFYKCRWSGINVFGNSDPSFGLSFNSNLHGKVSITSGATIKNAQVGIQSNPGGNNNRGGGIIVTDNANFKNNRRSIGFFNYIEPVSMPSHLSLSNINHSVFSTTNTPINGYIEGAVLITPTPSSPPYYMETGRSIGDFIADWNVDGVKIGYNNFSQDYNILSAIPGYNLGTGIVSIDASYSVQRGDDPMIGIGYGCIRPTGGGNTFENLSQGIVYSNSINPLGLNIFENNFINVTRGIYGSGEENSRIYGNNFTFTSNFNWDATIGNSTSIKLESSKGYSIFENSINWPSTIPLNNASYTGISVYSSNLSSSGKAPINNNNKFKEDANPSPINEFYGLVTVFDILAPDIKCNDFSLGSASFICDWFTNSDIKNQGNSSYGAGNIFSATPKSLVNIYDKRPSSAPIPAFTYYYSGSSPLVSTSINLSFSPSMPTCTLASYCEIYNMGYIGDPGQNGIINDNQGKGVSKQNVLSDQATKNNNLHLSYSEFNKTNLITQNTNALTEKLSNCIVNLNSGQRNFTVMNQKEVAELRTVATEGVTSISNYANTLLQLFQFERIKENKVEYVPRSEIMQNKLYLSNNSISIFPNPSNSIFNINYKSNIDFKSGIIQVMDYQGRVIKSVQIYNNQGRVKLDLSDYAVGLYNCSLFINGIKVGDSKIVLEK
jgi:hypothetical protein